MNSLKCPQCGLVNFATAPECKRCHIKFHQPEPVSESSATADEPAADEVPMDEPAPDPEPTETVNQPYSPAPLPEYFEVDYPGLNAAMILFALYLLLAIAVLGFQLNQLSQVWHGGAWGSITNPGQFYIPYAETLFYFTWFLHILGIVASLVLMIPLLVKLRAFLIMVRVYLLGGFVYFAVQITSGISLRTSLIEKLPTQHAWAEPMLESLLWNSILQIIGFLVTFIWFRYFTTSERVKKTFIH